jgi:excisionase family DNA binding protein
MNDSVLTSSKAAELLGMSRQHVADLADSGALRGWRTGSHRRFRREDVLAFGTTVQKRVDVASQIDSLSLTDRRSLAYGHLIAAQVVARPEWVMEIGRQNLAHLRAVHSDGSADSYFDCWEELLSGPVERLLAVLISTDERSIDLRHVAPFAGILSEDERLKIIKNTRTAV